MPQGGWHGHLARVSAWNAARTSRRSSLPVLRETDDWASWAGRPCHKGGGTGILPVFASWAGRPCHKGLQTGIA